MLKLGVILLVAVSTTVNSQCFSKDDGSKKLNPDARTHLYRNQLEFTLNLFNTIDKAVPDDNIFFSPFSVYHALLLGYFAAGGETEKALKQSLRISDAQVIFKSSIRKLESNSSRLLYITIIYYFTVIHTR